MNNLCTGIFVSLLCMNIISIIFMFLYKKNIIIRKLKKNICNRVALKNRRLSVIAIVIISSIIFSNYYELIPVISGIINGLVCGIAIFFKEETFG